LTKDRAGSVELEGEAKSEDVKPSSVLPPQSPVNRLSGKFKPVAGRVARAVQPYTEEAAIAYRVAKQAIRRLPDNLDITDDQSREEFTEYIQDLRVSARRNWKEAKDGFVAVGRAVGLGCVHCARGTGSVAAAWYARCAAWCRTNWDVLVARLMAPAFPDEPDRDDDDLGIQVVESVRVRKALTTGSTPTPSPRPVREPAVDQQAMANQEAKQ
jgi:hypothetical protein